MNVKSLCCFVLIALQLRLCAKTFNVLDYGAKGDGVTLDTVAIQETIDVAAEDFSGLVLIPGHHKFLISTLNLKGGIDFHLKGELIISTNQSDYTGEGVIMASNAANLKITGHGKITGRSLSFMTGYDAPNEWWLFKPWRPKMFVLTGCTNLVVRDITFGDEPFWGLHMLDCENVLVENITVNNRLDVPNCDGIDPDHSRNVEIHHCRVTCGDDGIVAKATRQTQDFGPCANVHVSDCVIRTQDAGLKIGTETTSDVHDVVFEHCHVLSSSRGLCIQLRDEGSVYNVVFRNITFESEYHSAPWWGRVEAISFTAFPRTPDTKNGRIHDIVVENVCGRAENSIRVNGSAQSRIENVRFQNVAMAFDRWTKYNGGVFDNRPTKVLATVEPHETDGFNLQFADQIELNNCSVRYSTKNRLHFSDAVSATDASALQVANFKGNSPAHPIFVR